MKIFLFFCAALCCKNFTFLGCLFSFIAIISFLFLVLLLRPPFIYNILTSFGVLNPAFYYCNFLFFNIIERFPPLFIPETSFFFPLLSVVPCTAFFLSRGLLFRCSSRSFFITGIYPSLGNGFLPLASRIPRRIHPMARLLLPRMWKFRQFHHGITYISRKLLPNRSPWGDRIFLLATWISNGSS